jgi:hypothetical protein
MTDTLSSQIYLSRDSIRRQISDLVKEYLELENVDLTKSSFLSFLIDAISALTSNLLFYQISTYREFFLTTAQLPESILNLSSFLGYNTSEASYSTVNVLFTIPLTFTDPSVEISIPEGFTVKSDSGIEFITYYDVDIEISNNASARITLQEGNKTYILPVSIDDDGLSFLLPMRQIKIVVQEFQIDEDVREFQFVTLDVPVDGQVATIQVELRDPGSSAFTLWTEFNSLYLMTDSDLGYVSRRTDEGRRLFFGNGLIGVQPTPGATVRVTTGVTEGADGNVIAGSIKTGDRLYTETTGGVVQVVNYEVVNASPALGGADEESLEEIRANSIASLTALNRLVSESDYQNIDVIIPESSFAANSLPVLKRSDIKVNEIQLFTTQLFGASSENVENIVPTRNVTYTVPDTTTLIPRGTVITEGDFQYYTLFDLELDNLNSAANYEYVLLELNVSPALQTSYVDDYDLVATLVEVEKSGNDAVFKLQYQSSEPDADLTQCELRLTQSGSVKPMINDATAGYFIYTFSPYTNFPSGEQDIIFRLKKSDSSLVADYNAKVTFRQDLSSFMISNTAIDGTASIKIYDIPVVEKEYYDSVVKRDFEAAVLQTLVSSLDLSSRRMLTDFTNVKFTNTVGNLQNMKLNNTTRAGVLDIVETLPTVCAESGARYIYIGNDDNKNSIATCIDATAGVFVFSPPNANTIVYVTSQNEKYIFSANGWIPIPEYEMPLKVSIEVFRSDDYAGTLTELSDSVRETVFEAFKSRFGANIELYRSEIIDVVQEIDGVDHCRLIEPETGIFFDFDLIDLTEEELLEYGPEYVYFTENDITVTII